MVGGWGAKAVAVFPGRGREEIACLAKRRCVVGGRRRRRRREVAGYLGHAAVSQSSTSERECTGWSIAVAVLVVALVQVHLL